MRIVRRYPRSPDDTADRRRDHAYYVTSFAEQRNDEAARHLGLYLEHTKDHEYVSQLDLFAATPAALRKIVEGCGLLYLGSLGPPENSVLIFSKDQTR